MASPYVLILMTSDYKIIIMFGNALFFLWRKIIRFFEVFNDRYQFLFLLGAFFKREERDVLGFTLKRTNRF